MLNGTVWGISSEYTCFSIVYQLIHQQVCVWNLSGLRLRGPLTKLYWLTHLWGGVYRASYIIRKCLFDCWIIALNIFTQGILYMTIIEFQLSTITIRMKYMTSNCLMWDCYVHTIWTCYIEIILYPFCDFRQFVFVVVFSTFLIECINYDVLFANIAYNHTHKVTIPETIYPVKQCFHR